MKVLVLRRGRDGRRVTSALLTMLVGCPGTDESSSGLGESRSEGAGEIE